MRGLCKTSWSADILVCVEEVPMEIQWTDEVDAALQNAKESGKPLLLDFSAAPM
jgi:hypothetical protein